MVRKILKSLKKITLGILICTIIPSCSFIGELWYKNLDNYLANYFFEYANFSGDQKKYINEATKKFAVWHKKNELPKYKKNLFKLKNPNIYNDVASIEDTYENFYKLFKDSNNFFTPFFTEFSVNLTDSQVNEIKKHFNKINEENNKKYQNTSFNQYINELKINTVQGLKRLGIYLTEKQKNNVFLRVDKINDNRERYISNQKRWNEGLIDILSERQKEFFKILLMKHINIADNEDDVGNGYEDNKKKWLLIVKEVMGSLNKNQKQNFDREIDRYIELINGIIQD